MYFDEVKRLATPASPPFSLLEVDTVPFGDTQNGWPSVDYTGVEPQTDTAVASVSSEQGYFSLLDEHCTDLKSVVSGGIGWFAHIYSDAMERGYGIYSASGKLKFPFAPRTSC